MITDPKQAGLLMQPLKAAILESLAEPATTAELAQRLSTPRQRLGYHVRQLEGAGLLEVVGETKVRNCVGRQLRSIARRFLVAPEAGPAPAGDCESTQDRFSSARLIELSARTISEVTRLSQAATKAGKEVATLCLDDLVSFDSHEDRQAFVQELTEVLQALEARYGSAGPAARPCRLQIACYPRPPAGEPEPS